MGGMHTQGKDHVGKQKEGGHMQAKERFQKKPILPEHLSWTANFQKCEK